MLKSSEHRRTSVPKSVSLCAAADDGQIAFWGDDGQLYQFGIAFGGVCFGNSNDGETLAQTNGGEHNGQLLSLWHAVYSLCRRLGEALGMQLLARR